MVAAFSEPHGPGAPPAIHVDNRRAGVCVPLLPHAKLCRGLLTFGPNHVSFQQFKNYSLILAAPLLPLFKDFFFPILSHRLSGCCCLRKKKKVLF